jgi:uncharacterized protein (DUF2252 family)
MRPLGKVTREILTQNSGRDLDRLTLKFAALRADPFAFFRGTNPLYLGLLPRKNSLFEAPNTLVCGDLHLENFGAFKGDNRLCYFDLNDFDEACLAPFTLDIVRFLSSVHVAAPGLGLSRASAKAMADTFLEAYAQAVADGKPRWVERSLAQGVFRALLRRAMQRTRTELLDRFTKLKGGERRIRAGKRALPIDAKRRAQLKRFMKHLCLPGVGSRFFKLLDAARRVAGNGSLGLSRYVLLVQGRGAPDGHFALDLKFAAPSAAAEWLQTPQPNWPNEASRVVSIQKIMQAIAPALLHPVYFEERAFVLKELQPAVDRLALAEWRQRPRRITQAIVGMAHVTAWAHLRSCGHCGASSAESLQAYVAKLRWRSAAQKLAVLSAKRLHQAWQVYSKDYDSGAVTTALQTAAAKAKSTEALFF